MDSPHQELAKLFKTLGMFNPDVAELHRERILEIAGQVDVKHWPKFKNLTEELFQHYLKTDWKVSERNILNKYFAQINRVTRAMSEVPVSADVDVPPAVQAPPSCRNTAALVPNYQFTAMQWFEAIRKAEVPTILTHAVDATELRSQLTHSVIEVALGALKTISLPLTVQWELQYLKRHRENLDTDIMRDLLRSWQGFPEVPAEALDFAAEWALNSDLEMIRPVITKEADRLLRQRALRHWESSNPSKRLLFQQLRKKLRPTHDETALEQWLDEAINQIGHAIQATLNLSDLMTTAEQRAAPPALEQTARMLNLTLVNLTELFIPVLILADILLPIPDGPYRLALAVFGITRQDLEHWRQHWEAQAADVVRQILLDDLRRHATPVDTIRAFCLGDRELLRQLTNKLDLISKQFDSVKQREEAINHLASFYASFRETDFINKEIVRRFRNLVRSLHPDRIGRFAESGPLPGQTQNIIDEIYSLATAARKYLSARRDTRNSVEIMLCTEADFIRSLRRQRLRIIRLTV